jgi:hypothetical protein
VQALSDRTLGGLFRAAGVSLAGPVAGELIAIASGPSDLTAALHLTALALLPFALVTALDWRGAARRFVELPLVRPLGRTERRPAGWLFWAYRTPARVRAQGVVLALLVLVWCAPAVGRLAG